jgi:hypothetical protein
VQPARDGLNDRRQVFPRRRQIPECAVQVGPRARPQGELDPVGQLGERQSALRKVAPKRRGSLFPVMIADKHSRPMVAVGSTQFVAHGRLTGESGSDPPAEIAQPSVGTGVLCRVRLPEEAPVRSGGGDADLPGVRILGDVRVDIGRDDQHASDPAALVP